MLGYAASSSGVASNWRVMGRIQWTASSLLTGFASESRQSFFPTSAFFSIFAFRHLSGVIFDPGGLFSCLQYLQCFQKWIFVAFLFLQSGGIKTQPKKKQRNKANMKNQQHIERPWEMKAEVKRVTHQQYYESRPPSLIRGNLFYLRRPWAIWKCRNSTGWNVAEAEPLLLIFANKLPIGLFVNCQTAAGQGGSGGWLEWSNSPSVGVQNVTLIG